MPSSDTIDYWQPVTKTEQTSQWVVGLGDQLQQATQVEDVPWPVDQGRLQTARTPNSFWLIYSFATAGKLAIRTCFDPQTIRAVRVHKRTKTTVDYHVEGSLGRFHVRLERSNPSLLRYTTSLEPKQAFTVQAFPRDVYVLDDADDPAATEGMLYMTQSGPTSGLAYLSLTQPVAGTVVYFQNLTR